ncbi:MAG: fibronectin type III domain-containing protein [Nitrospiraceae bacterium]|nr:fibronectin type III domain-containing protein [Nitrospiraceae bacterium]
MKSLFSLLISAILLGTVSIAGGNPGQHDAPAAAEETGAVAGAPTGLHLRIVPNGFHLAWTLSPQDPGIVTGYEIVRADRFSGPYDSVATVGKGISQYVDETASQEIIYFYKVRAVAEKVFSPYSNTVTGER